MNNPNVVVDNDNSDLVLSSGLNQVQSRLVHSFRVVISFSIVTLVETGTVFKNN